MSDKKPKTQSVAMKAFCTAVRPPGEKITPDEIKDEINSISFEIECSEHEVQSMRSEVMHQKRSAELLKNEIDYLDMWLVRTYELTVACRKFCNKWNKAYQSMIACESEIKKQLEDISEE
jgi:hypothetical protein